MEEGQVKMGLLLACYLLTLFLPPCKTTDIRRPKIAYCDVSSRRNNLTGTDNFGFYANMQDFSNGAVDTSTQLGCCAQGYDKLEWIKDGIPIPFRTASRYASRHDGRILIIKETKASDQGYYTCKITKGNQTRQHKVYLFVEGKSPYPPPTVSERPDNTSAPVGGKAEFLCEGRFAIDQPLALKYVDWFRIRPNGTGRMITSDMARHAVITNYREQRLYKNARLIIDPVIEEDFYNTYQCKIYNLHSIKQVVSVSLTKAEPTPAPIFGHGPYPVIGTILMVLLVTLVIAFLLYRHFQLEMKLILWDTFGKNEITANASAGAFLVYNGDNKMDHEFATVTLLDRLEMDLGYPILVPDRDFIPGSAIGDEYIRCMTSSARFVAILSPAFFEDPWCVIALNNALENHHKMVFVVHQEIENWEEIDVRDTMRSAMSVIKSIEWPGEDDSKNVERFFKKLRLRLPPRLKSPNSEQQDQKVPDLMEHEKTVTNVEQDQHEVLEVKRQQQDFTRF